MQTQSRLTTTQLRTLRDIVRSKEEPPTPPAPEGKGGMVLKTIWSCSYTTLKALEKAGMVTCEEGVRPTEKGLMVALLRN